MSKNIFKIKNGVLVDVLDKNITEAVVPNGVTSIGEFAFRGCTSLKSVTIPDSVTIIGDSAFRNCISLTSVTVPDSVTSIGYAAFRGCTSLTSVTVGDSVTIIGEFAFYYCTSLTSINVDENNSNYCDIAGVLFNKDKTKLIQYPSGKAAAPYTIPDSVTSIGNYAFSGCTSLTSVTIGDSVTSIGDKAFWNCTSLTSVTIGDSITSIDWGTFKSCKCLTSVTIGESVTNIGEYAFSGCKSLKSIKIPESVRIIDCEAFLGCASLKSETSNYKAFNLRDGNLFCKGYQFTPNEWSKEEFDIEPCKRGYHYCTNLFEIFNYYWGKIDKDIAIYECEVGDKVIDAETSKCCTNKIKPFNRLYREDIIKLLNI